MRQRAWSSRKKRKAEITESIWPCGWNQRANVEVEEEVKARMLLINIQMNIRGRISDKPELDVQTIFISADPDDVKEAVL